MKQTILGLSVMVWCVAVQAQTKKPAPKPAAKPVALVLKTKNDSLSYAFGISLGSYLKSQELTTVNYTAMNKAIDQILKGQPTVMDVNGANQMMGQIVEAKNKKALTSEKARGQAFLEANKLRQGVATTASGLQYEILTKGTGAVPKLTDTIVAHYRGTLVDGKEFDNSYSRGEPITIPVSGVIAGWTEALQMMPVGSKWKLFIPSSSGYGDYGAGQDIPGGATLVFEVELVSIKNQQ
jgi:FKBP-type peptidyl-prolyl cis-trans isomerase